MATVAVANKPITIEGVDYVVGDLIPDARKLRNYDALVRVRKIKEVDSDDLIPEDVLEEQEPEAPAAEPEAVQEPPAEATNEDDSVSIEEFLKMSVDEIVEALSEADLDTVTAVIEVEQSGKNRTTLIKRLEGLFE